MCGGRMTNFRTEFRFSQFVFFISFIFSNFYFSFAHAEEISEAIQIKMAPSAVAEGFYENSEGSPLIPLVKLAKSTIDIEIYEMEDPGFRQALRESLARGVRLRILKDPSP